MDEEINASLFRQPTALPLCLLLARVKVRGPLLVSYLTNAPLTGVWILEHLHVRRHA